MFATSLNKWRGCVEERDTTASSTFNSATLPPDLDPDLPATDASTKWRPVWPEDHVVPQPERPDHAAARKTLNPNPYSDSTAQKRDQRQL